jgi:hypothetical protein
LLGAALFSGAPAFATTFDQYSLTFQGSTVGSSYFDVLATILVEGTDVESISGLVSGQDPNIYGPSTPLTLITQAGTPPGQSTYTSGATGQQWNYDDEYFAAGDPVVDNNGLLFTDGTGNIFNLYSVGTTYYLSVDSPSSLFNPGDPGILTVATLAPVVTPLPSTWTMLIAGFFGLGFLALRGRKQRSDVFAAA